MFADQLLIRVKLTLTPGAPCEHQEHGYMSLPGAWTYVSSHVWSPFLLHGNQPLPLSSTWWGLVLHLSLLPHLLLVPKARLLVSAYRDLPRR